MGRGDREGGGSTYDAKGSMNNPAAPAARRTTTRPATPIFVCAGRSSGIIITIITIIIKPQSSQRSSRSSSIHKSQQQWRQQQGQQQGQPAQPHQTAVGRQHARDRRKKATGHTLASEKQGIPERGGGGDEMSE